MNSNAHPLVSIIVVNWNGARVLQACLRAIFAQTYRDFEVILVDNNSADGSVDDVERRWPQVKLMRLTKNLGYAAANNLAATIAAGQWLALLNSDAFPEPGWLEALLRAAGLHQQVYFFASCQLRADDPSRLDGTGDEYHVSGIAWRRQSNEPSNLASPTIDEVFSACGAAALYPREAYLKVGGFDEDFFSYLEDVDLGFRLRLEGYRCLYVPEARVAHVGSSTLGGLSDFALYHSQRNMLWTFLKNMPSTYMWRYLPLHLAANLGQGLLYSLCCCPRIVLRAKLDALKGLPAVLRKRRRIQSHARIAPEEIARVIKFSTRRYTFSLKTLLLLPAILRAGLSSVKACREERRVVRVSAGDSLAPTHA